MSSAAAKRGPPLPVVLYVDDSPDDRFLLERAAERGNASFRVQAANEMQAAIKYFETEDNKVPAMVITDYVLHNFRAPICFDGLAPDHSGHKSRRSSSAETMTPCVFRPVMRQAHTAF
jgi:hypothetical protein